MPIARRVVISNYMATHDDVLALDNKMKTHQRHLQFLAIEIYKSKNKLNPSFMWKTYKAFFSPCNKSRFYRQIGDKSKVIAKMTAT